jgi:NAD kinase
MQNFVDGKNLGLDERMRLKISMGEGVNQKRTIFRGSQLEHGVEMKINNFHVMNEIVVDRGPSPSSVQLKTFVNGDELTTCIGDGIILATPTGSTAYSMSAGGSIVDTNTKSICLTPLAPHSLSFRPIIFLDTTQIKVQKVNDNRGPAWVSLDGATRFKLEDGESLVMTGSKHPLKFITKGTDNLTDLWIQRLKNGFNWNVRDEFKPFKKSSYRSHALLDDQELKNMAKKSTKNNAKGKR